MDVIYSTTSYNNIMPVRDKLPRINNSITYFVSKYHNSVGDVIDGDRIGFYVGIDAKIIRPDRFLE